MNRADNNRSFDYPPLTAVVRTAAQNVADSLGPSMSEAVYHSGMETELSRFDVLFDSDNAVPVSHRNHVVGHRRPDITVSASSDTTDDGEERVAVELKSGGLRDKHRRQVASYVRLLDDQHPDVAIGGVLVGFGAKSTDLALACETYTIDANGSVHGRNDDIVNQFQS